jgi:hypothetical protein
VDTLHHQHLGRVRPGVAAADRLAPERPRVLERDLGAVEVAGQNLLRLF